MEVAREQLPWGGKSQIILRGVRAMVTTIVFNPLLINPDNPQIDFFSNSKLMRMEEAFSDIPCIEMSSHTLY
jgi:hypothetical protein